MIRLMRGPIDNEPTFVAAAQGALDRNTDELVDAVAQAYGDDAGTQFRSLWEEHIQLLHEYSEAVADHDTKGMDKAMSALEAYADRYGEADRHCYRRRAERGRRRGRRGPNTSIT
jgi:hypothetical protein